MSANAPIRDGACEQSGRWRMVETEKQESFVARIWLEGASDQKPTWRGHLRHVQDEEECYFQSFSTMKAFLERVSGVPFPEGGNDDEC